MAVVSTHGVCGVAKQPFSSMIVNDGVNTLVGPAAGASPAGASPAGTAGGSSGGCSKCRRWRRLFLLFGEAKVSGPVSEPSAGSSLPSVIRWLHGLSTPGCHQMITWTVSGDILLSSIERVLRTTMVKSANPTRPSRRRTSTRASTSSARWWPSARTFPRRSDTS